nr:DUF1173 family protein [Brucella intermedia]
MADRMEPMRRFSFDAMAVEAVAPDFQDPGVRRYIAQVAGQHLVKRMPLSGGGHDPACSSFQTPDNLPGHGALIGNAIQADADTGMSALRVGFRLTRLGTRSSQIAETGSSVLVATENWVLYQSIAGNVASKGSGTLSDHSSRSRQLCCRRSFDRWRCTSFPRQWRRTMKKGFDR